MTLSMRTGLVALAGGGAINALPDKAKPFVGAATGIGAGYVAASVLHNPNGKVAKTVTEGATKATKFLTDAIKKIKGSSLYKTIAGNVTKKGGFVRNSIATVKKGIKNIKNTGIYQKASNVVQKGVSKLTSNSTFQKLVSTVKNSSVGKWVAKNPKLAAGVAAATVLIGLVTSTKADKKSHQELMQTVLY